ncbi:MAG TPA: hypothetical protein IAB72_04480 [Candidatus Onthoplasma faecipullorum]|nr:hypothetical protein [Candidatus Onthoplasma faecipullorum]
MKDNSTNLIARLKSIKEKARKRIDAEHRVEELREDIERLTKEKDEAIQNQLDAENDYLMELSKFAFNRPISAIDYARELIKINKPEESEKIDNDVTLKIETGYTISSVFTDIDLSDEMFQTVMMPDGNLDFKKKSDKDKEKRLELVRNSLRDRIKRGLWSGLSNVFLFVGGNSGFVNIYASVNFAMRFNDGTDLLDHVESATYSFMPTVEYGRAYMKLEITLRLDKLDDVIIFLNSEDFCCISENEQYVMLNDEATRAFCNVIEHSVKQ